METQVVFVGVVIDELGKSYPKGEIVYFAGKNRKEIEQIACRELRIHARYLLSFTSSRRIMVLCYSEQLIRFAEKEVAKTGGTVCLGIILRRR